MCNKTPHKHAELIKAWADGAIIQYKVRSGVWSDVYDNTPTWGDWEEYRIKPEPKPDVITYAHVIGVCKHRRPEVVCSSSNNWNVDSKPSYTQMANVKFTFDGETGKLKKAEVIA